MKITNKKGIPEPIYNAITYAYNDYDTGDIPIDYSVTSLIDPAWMSYLRKKHSEDITAEALDLLYLSDGKAYHKLIEHANKDNPNMICEQRYNVRVEGYVIGGGVDLYYDKTIVDFKRTKALAMVFKSRMEEWKLQLNAYRLLMEMHGYQVNKLQIYAILRDWDKYKYTYDNKDGNYPDSPIQVINIPVLPLVDIEDWIRLRIMYHNKVHKGEITECNEDERWEKSTQYKVRKKGVKRARGVHDNYESAYRHQMSCSEKDKKSSFYIETFPGRRVRCEDWCSVNRYCQSYQDYLKNKVVNDE